MKNNQNKKWENLSTSNNHWSLQCFSKNNISSKNTLNFDNSECSKMFHEKLQIIFANIRV